jgi:hypothetical protein
MKLVPYDIKQQMYTDTDTDTDTHTHRHARTNLVSPGVVTKVESY